ncbi:SRPBCC family protein [Mycobacterium sp. URHB0044]|jgi:hypothetical protein|uniref:type II toxin-antitoxin system Rv0910 family toxin n=1 Tax=Mycobacterium sp. URHB0044 TaxID=1380386 RepID=UPI0007E8BFA4|nr:SRPBCC family protein [Mycobacterium sp. URHB0044]
MGHVAVSRHLAAAPDALWAIVADPRTWDEWFTVHGRWLVEPPASLAAGTRLTAGMFILGVANNIVWTVESIIAPVSMMMVGTGVAGLTAQCGFTITPAGTGSRFTVVGDFAGTLVRGSVVKAVEREGVAQLVKSMALLEALASGSEARARAGALRPALRLVHGLGPTG